MLMIILYSSQILAMFLYINIMPPSSNTIAKYLPYKMQNIFCCYLEEVVSLRQINNNTQCPTTPPFIAAPSV